MAGIYGVFILCILIGILRFKKGCNLIRNYVRKNGEVRGVKTVKRFILALSMVVIAFFILILVLQIKILGS